MRVLNKTREYLDYLEQHHENIWKAWDIVQEACGDELFVREDICKQAVESALNKHDLSRLGPEEFIPCRVEFYPSKPQSLDYFCYTADFRRAKKHHRDENYHHWYSFSLAQSCLSPEWWLTYLVEMVVNWLAKALQDKTSLKAKYLAIKPDIEGAMSKYALDKLDQIVDMVTKHMEENNG